MILGIQWFETLGPVTTNWKTQSMTFMWQDRRVRLVGVSSLKRTKILLKAMIKMIRKKGGGILMECNGMEGIVKNPIPSYLQSTMETYARTPMFSNHNAPYPYRETKTMLLTLQIERLVQDMLKAGIIHHRIC